MSEKKKKPFPVKEPTTRRPVILKSEREPLKEVPKEKPPTIILKSREQSAPKDDRPHSPKNSESEGIQPSKIAQNENKEKKIIEKPHPPLKLMTEPVKLLDEKLEFNNAALEFMHDTNLNYLVVGVIGTQGVGKSTVLNLIAENNLDSNICQRILDSHEIPSAHGFEEKRMQIEEDLDNLHFVSSGDKKQNISGENFKFKVQDIDQIERGVHCTQGIDMYVTDDRVILLDCQALWSPALIHEPSGSTPLAARSANTVTIDGLQLTSFLMAVCHVVIAVQDWFVDYNFIRYIQAAEMLTPSPAAGAEPERPPRLLLLHNRCRLEDFTPPAARCMQDFYRKSFLKSRLQLWAGAAPAAPRAVNLCLLPEVYEDYDNKDIYRGHPPFEKLAQNVKAMVLGFNRHQITNLPNLTEKSWFLYCNKSWDTIRKCSFHLEYERFLP